MIAEFINPANLGFILVGVMLFAIFVGFPISFTLIFLGFVFGYLGFGKLVFYLMTLQFSMVMTEQTLAAVPLFVFMGIMMEQAGLISSAIMRQAIFPFLLHNNFSILQKFLELIKIKFQTISKLRLATCKASKQYPFLVHFSLLILEQIQLSYKKRIRDRENKIRYIM